MKVFGRTYQIIDENIRHPKMIQKLKKVEKIFYNFALLLFSHHLNEPVGL